MRAAAPMDGRLIEHRALHELLSRGLPVIVAGPMGIGKSHFLRLALAEQRTRWAPCVAARSALVNPLGRLIGERVDVSVADRAARHVASRLAAETTVVLDDVQFADAHTLATIARLSRLVPIVVGLRTGEPGSIDSVEALCTAGYTIIELGGLPEVLATAISAAAGASGEHLADVVTRAAGNPLWCRELATAAPSSSTRDAVRAHIARLEPPARTALALLGLAGRPLHRAILGPAVDDLLRADLVALDGDIAAARVDLFADAAAATLSPPDRSTLHRVLGERLADPMERAQHLAAGGDPRRGADLMLEGVSALDAPARAAHLAIAAEWTDDDEYRLAAAHALLDCGDLARARRCAQGIVAPALAPDAAAVLATVNRLEGDHGAALTNVERGLATWANAGGVEGPASRRLRREHTLAEHHLGRSSPDQTINALRADGPGSRSDGAEAVDISLSVAEVLLGAGHRSWHAEAALGIDAAYRSGLIGAELAGRWLIVVGLTVSGDFGHATAEAEAGTARARAANRPAWAERFEREAAWCRLVHLGPGAPTPTADRGAPSLAPDEPRAALAATDSGLHDVAEALLVAARCSRSDAVRACMAWWVHADADVRRFGRAALRSAPGDPIVRLLVTPLLWWCDDSSVIEGGTATVPATPADPGLATVGDFRYEQAALTAARSGGAAARLFRAAAARWSSVSRRDQVRCLWAAAEHGARERWPDAIAVLAEADAAAASGRINAVAPRLAATARRLGQRTTLAVVSMSRTAATRRDDTIDGMAPPAAGSACPPAAAMERASAQPMSNTPANWIPDAAATPGGVTDRERGVLLLVGQGLSSAMIARRLDVSVATVESHIASARRKLGAANRRQAATRVSR